MNGTTRKHRVSAKRNACPSRNCPASKRATRTVPIPILLDSQARFNDVVLANTLLNPVRICDRFGLTHIPLHDYLRKFD
jgi:hypothetical protein